jgi:hypothetical protein
MCTKQQTYTVIFSSTSLDSPILESRIWTVLFCHSLWNIQTTSVLCACMSPVSPDSVGLGVDSSRGVRTGGYATHQDPFHYLYRDIFRFACNIAQQVTSDFRSLWSVYTVGFSTLRILIRMKIGEFRLLQPLKIRLNSAQKCIVI